MTEGFGNGEWLPAAVQRRMAAEDGHERAEARRAEAERADHADKAHDRALGAYRAAAEGRGEVLSAMELATGQGLGRSLGDVFAAATAAADREDAIAAARERNQDVCYLDGGGPVQRAEADTGYEDDRMIRLAQDNHSALITYLARRDYRPRRRRHGPGRRRRRASSARARAATRRSAALSVKTATSPGRSRDHAGPAGSRE